MCRDIERWSWRIRTADLLGDLGRWFNRRQPEFRMTSGFAPLAIRCQPSSLCANMWRLSGCSGRNADFCLNGPPLVQTPFQALTETSPAGAQQTTCGCAGRSARTAPFATSRGGWLRFGPASQAPQASPRTSSAHASTCRRVQRPDPGRGGGPEAWRASGDSSGLLIRLVEPHRHLVRAP